MGKLTHQVFLDHGFIGVTREPDGMLMIPVKFVAEFMERSPQPLIRRLSRSPVMSVERHMFPTASGKRSVACLPLSRLPLALAAIDPGDVSPERRARLAAHRLECETVIARENGISLQKLHAFVNFRLGEVHGNA